MELDNGSAPRSTFLFATNVGLRFDKNVHARAMDTPASVRAHVDEIPEIRKSYLRA